MGYVILVDTREKKPWDFAKARGCDQVFEKKLDTGDYTVRGMEKVFCIERKGSVSEFAGNLLDKGRFERELDRMKDIKFSFILLEFEMKDLLLYPKQLPKKVQRNIRINGYTLLKKMINILQSYPHINILFCGYCGKDVASSIFKRMIEEYGEEFPPV